MARAKGILQLNGIIGDLVFYQLDGKTVVRRKPSGVKMQIKHGENYTEHRQRTHYLKLTNSLATAIYRMAKEYSAGINYKSHNKLVKSIYHQVKFKPKEAIDFSVLRNDLKGLSLNYKDTLPPVAISVYEGDILLGCDKKITHLVSVHLVIGTLPRIHKAKGQLAANNDMEDVEIIELTVQPEDHGQNLRVPMSLKANQVVVAITRYHDGESEQEWVRVV